MGSQAPDKNRTAQQQDLISSFADPVDCLTAHLMLECAEVLAGVKPANLIPLTNRTRPCGRNLYQIWNRHKSELSYTLPRLEFLELRQHDRAVLLLCFSRQHLTQQLSHKGIRALLVRAGYPADSQVDELLAELVCRVRTNGSFPHEIGLFIGYPAKDVAAFMGLINLPFTCQGPWKIFGYPSKSLCLAEQFKNCRSQMTAMMTSATSETTAPKRIAALFCTFIDNENHKLVHRGDQ